MELADFRERSKMATLPIVEPPRRFLLNRTEKDTRCGGAICSSSVCPRVCMYILTLGFSHSCEISCAAASYMQMGIQHQQQVEDASN